MMNPITVAGVCSVTTITFYLVILLRIEYSGPKMIMNDAKNIHTAHSNPFTESFLGSFLLSHPSVPFACFFFSLDFSFALTKKEIIHLRRTDSIGVVLWLNSSPGSMGKHCLLRGTQDNNNFRQQQQEEEGECLCNMRIGSMDDATFATDSIAEHPISP